MPRRPITRRSLLATAGAGMATIAPFAPNAASQGGPPAVHLASTLTITGYYRTPAFLVAESRGYFARERLDVEFHLVRLAPEHYEGLANGRWSVTLSSADTMLARTTQDGADFVIFMQAEEGLDVQLVAQPHITSPADLRGRLLAADPVDSNYDLVRNKILREHGLTERDYKIDVLGNSSARLAAFEAGKVDAAMLQATFSERAVAKGGVVLAEGAAYVANWPIVCGWGLRSWVTAQRSTAVRLVRALSMATDWLLDPANREETIRLMMSQEKLSRARAERNYGFVVAKCAISPQALRKNIELRIELGYYKPPHKAAEAFYDASIWAEATGLAPSAPAGLPRNAKPG